MSTSATQPGTTTRAGRSGKGLGIAAAALAVVIAAGFVFAVNQGNDATRSAVQSEPSGPAQAAAERHADRVAAQAQAESHPGFNIEKTKMELANQVAVISEYPGLNPEKTRTEMLIDKLDEQIYVPSTEQATELNQPEWDNRIP
ncbi:MAG TPA: hypothetical protein VFU96_12315 [Acidimicrobiia bacterium]|nr:hypothetical protein [Acidimicrobiia bacterium]